MNTAPLTIAPIRPGRQLPDGHIGNRMRMEQDVAPDDGEDQAHPPGQPGGEFEEVFGGAGHCVRTWDESVRSSERSALGVLGWV